MTVVSPRAATEVVKSRVNRETTCGSKYQEQNQDIWPESQRRTEMPFTTMGMGGLGTRRRPKIQPIALYMFSHSIHTTAPRYTLFHHSHFVG